MTYLFALLFFLLPLLVALNPLPALTLTTSPLPPAIPLTIELFEFPKTIFLYGLTLLLATVFLFKSLSTGRLYLRKTSLTQPLLVFAFFFFLSFLFSIDKTTSFFGYYSRFIGGLLPTFSLILLFFLFLTEENADLTRKRVILSIRALLCGGFLVALWGVLEHFGIDAHWWTQDVRARVFSTLGQPNWLAAYLSALLPLALSLFLSARRTRFSFRTSLLFLLLLLLFAAFWYSHSLSGLLGLVGGLGIFALRVGGNCLWQNRARLLLLLLSWGVIVLSDLTPSGIRVQDAVLTHGGQTGQIRWLVWQGTLELIKSFPLSGSGPETFAYSFLPFRPEKLNLTPEWDFLYNKAHNEYLNLAATLGLPALLVYLWLIFTFVRDALKEIAFYPGEEKLLKAGLFSGWTSLLFTQFFGFQVAATALFFFLFPALFFGLNLKPKSHALSLNLRPFFRKTAAVTTLLVCLFSFGWLARLWGADVAAGSVRRAPTPKEALALYREATKLNPFEPAYRRDLTDLLTKLALQDENPVPWIAEALGVGKEAYRLNPQNSLTLRSLARSFERLTPLNTDAATLGLKMLKEAVFQSPQDAKLRYLLAVLWRSRGEEEKSRLELDQALRLKPDYNETQELLEFYRHERSLR